MRNDSLLVAQLRSTVSRSKRELLDEAADTIEALLSEKRTADPESLRPKGKWEITGKVCIDGEYEDTIRCNKCGADNDRKSRYCPNCGAKMED